MQELKKNDNIMQKILFSLFAIFFIFIIIPIISNRDFYNVSNAATYENFEYEVDKETNNITIKEYVGNDSEVIIPNMIEGKKVTIIGDNAFEDNRSLSSIVIPEGITSIGEGAFDSCIGLTSITIPEGVTCIGKGAFSYCRKLNSVVINEGITEIKEDMFRGCWSLTDTTLPNSVTSIENNAFARCESLEKIIIPDRLIKIGNEAFDGCINLKSITIPAKVEIIGNNVFYNCAELKSINVVEENQYYRSIDGVLFNKELTELLKYPEAKKDVTQYNILNGITRIEDNAFDRCYILTNISIPDSVTNIGEGAFRYCESLTNITIPKGITYIGKEAFYGCWNLLSINVINSNQYYKSIDGVLFNAEVTELIMYPIGKDDITKYNIPEGVTKIENYAFYACDSLTYIIIPDSVTNIGTGAFYECIRLKSIAIPERVTCIKACTFECCTDLRIVEIPEGITEIGEYAFDSCTSLTSIHLPDSVKYIEYSAFSSCQSLTSVTIPDGVTCIEESVFENCKNLIYVEIPKSVKQIEGYAFCNCRSLISIHIPSSVSYISYMAFRNCVSLTDVNIEEGVEEISDEAFYNCTSLTNINIPNSITWIGDDAFSGGILNIASNSNEMVLPQIIRRVLDKDDILYSDDDFILNNCSLNNDKTKLIIDDNIGEDENATLEIKSGALSGMTIKVVKSGTIMYHDCIIEKWYENDEDGEWRDNKVGVIAILVLEDGAIVKNNDNKNCYVFEEDGEFTFEYENANGELKTATAEANGIEKFLMISVDEFEESQKDGIKYIENINPSTTIEYLLEKIETNGTVEIYIGTQKVEDENVKLATGMKLKIYNDNECLEYTIVVTGDLNGDGIMGDVDVLKLARYKAGLDTGLKGAYLQAADINRNKTCADDIDLLKMVRILVGYDRI